MHPSKCCPKEKSPASTKAIIAVARAAGDFFEDEYRNCTRYWYVGVESFDTKNQHLRGYGTTMSTGKREHDGQMVEARQHNQLPAIMMPREIPQGDDSPTKQMLERSKFGNASVGSPMTHPTFDGELAATSAADSVQTKPLTNKDVAPAADSVQTKPLTDKDVAPAQSTADTQMEDTQMEYTAEEEDEEVAGDEVVDLMDDPEGVINRVEGFMPLLLEAN